MMDVDDLSSGAPVPDPRGVHWLGPPDEVGSYPMVPIPVPGRPGVLWAGPRPTDPAALAAGGVDLVVCLVPRRHLPPPYLAAAEAHGHRFLEVPDFGVPRDVAAWDAAVAEVEARLAAGDQVLVHCQAGCGRTGTLCAGVLVRCGFEAEGAIKHFRRHRGCGPETASQVQWVADYEGRFLGS